MKQLLLDTHVLLWCLADSPHLTPATRELIDDSSHLVYVSAASIWEISIKQARGKLQVVMEKLWLALATGDYEELPVTASQAWLAGQLPPYHQDPFDRMLVAQAIHEGLTLVTHDNLLKYYEVPIILGLIVVPAKKSSFLITKLDESLRPVFFRPSLSGRGVGGKYPGSKLVNWSSSSRFSRSRRFGTSFSTAWAAWRQELVEMVCSINSPHLA